MCGIAGIVDINDSGLAAEELIHTMTRRMAHRGPDAEGYFTDVGIALGHRRLKIIDLERGQQPMYSEDGSLVVVFNGEIYNFRELRSELEAKGYRFVTDCDTEVILYAYREYGDRCVDKFRGMFAIALYDRRNRRLIVYRDRLGIKPVYYHLNGSRLVFASEIKPLLATMESTPPVNTGLLDFYMSVGYVPGEETLFGGVRKLPPGHSLVFNDGEVLIDCYWDLSDGPGLDVEDSQAIEEFEDLLTESVRLRLVSDVPLGAFLSGGLDSSSIVELMSRMSDEPVRTFSVGFEDDPSSNELGYAKQVAKHFNTIHHEYVLEPMQFFDSLDLLLEFTEEPIVEAAAIALYQLSVLAKEHVTVILSGEGGDEVLAGYPLHQIMPKVDALHRWIRFAPPPLRKAFGALFRSNEKLSKYWDWVSTPMPSRYQSISNDVTGSIKSSMYNDEVLVAAQQDTERYFRQLFERLSDGTNLRRMSYTDIKSWLPDDLLIKADKMTMAASLELRVPFLDHKVVEYATRLPDDLRLRGREGKHLLKKLMEGRLPSDIIYRKKQGFPVPTAKWFRETLYERVREVLLDESTRKRGYFKPSYVERLLERHKQGREDLSRRILSLLTLELWHRKYVD